VERVAASADLSPAEAERVISDVLAWYREPVEQYVRRRHAQLQAHGARNGEIWPRLADEIGERLFAGPELSGRQLRRLVYG